METTVEFNESEMDLQIDKAKAEFYKILMAKKRIIRRNWMEMNSLANEHVIETLSYRAKINCLISDTIESNEEIEKLSGHSTFMDSLEKLKIQEPQNVNSNHLKKFSPLACQDTSTSPNNWEDVDFDTDLEIESILKSHSEDLTTDAGIELDEINHEVRNGS